ncbi:MAG: tRNA 2-thiouridine(34) synthase MnmA [Clostridia bacterium]|nr:tRNA 2-thiouridine(34) synthase MnmA [Clostridia bacterium]
MEKKRVVVGMSGGVDSSVAAYLLKEQGYEVVGLFMNNWEDDGVCTAADDWDDVRAVCAKLEIPYYSIDFSKQYRDRVFSYFLDEYKNNRTPNPDVLCNREIKFGPFADYARKLGADCIATGHYCDISHDGDHRLLCAADEGKDQTYFLNQVHTEQLRDVIFPLGKMQKGEVRAITQKMGMVTAKKKDSTGICFIGERNFRNFLKSYLPMQAGDIVDLSGRKVGEHIGLAYYTLGQRRGLGIGGVKGIDGDRWYVVEKRLQGNLLVVSCGEGEELLSDGLHGSGINWIGHAPAQQFNCTAKFRYRQKAEPVSVEWSGDDITVHFDKPQRAVTPGQFAVFYDGNRCLGGATIERTFCK